jgi:hypothetical protein
MDLIDHDLPPECHCGLPSSIKKSGCGVKLEITWRTTCLTDSEIKVPLPNWGGVKRRSSGEQWYRYLLSDALFDAVRIIHPQ